MITIKDYTEPEEFIDPNQNPLLPKSPFRLLILGSSGSGKTNLLVNLIYDYLKFDGLFVCAKDVFEPKYSKLQDNFTMFDDIEKEDIIHCKSVKKKESLLELFDKYKKEKVLFSSDSSEFIKVDDLDPSMKNLVIFDDCITEKDQSDIVELFIRGRKKNASMIYLSQSYYATPINIRKNCNYFIFFSLQPKEIQQIIREIDGNLTTEEFKELYKKAIRNRFDFFMLDLVNPDMRYRRNFEPLKL